jgi:hypothetical protein
MSIPVIAGATLACTAGAIHNETMDNDVEGYDTDNLMNMLNLIEAHYFMMLNRIDWKKSYNLNLRSKLIKDFDEFKDKLFKVLLNQNK